MVCSRHYRFRAIPCCSPVFANSASTQRLRVARSPPGFAYVVSAKVFISRMQIFPSTHPRPQQTMEEDREADLAVAGLNSTSIAGAQVKVERAKSDGPKHRGGGAGSGGGVGRGPGGPPPPMGFGRGGDDRGRGDWRGGYSGRGDPRDGAGGRGPWSDGYPRYGYDDRGRYGGEDRGRYGGDDRSRYGGGGAGGYDDRGRPWGSAEGAVFVRERSRERGSHSSGYGRGDLLPSMRDEHGGRGAADGAADRRGPPHYDDRVPSEHERNQRGHASRSGPGAGHEDRRAFDECHSD